MDVASCAIIAILFLLHLTRLSHQLFVILVALEILLLCLRYLVLLEAADGLDRCCRLQLGSLEFSCL